MNTENMELKLVSEDQRRKLYEFGNGGTWKVCKVLNVLSMDEIGGHYHKRKTELFCLVSGSGKLFYGKELWVRGGQLHCSIERIQAPFSILIEPKTYHSFQLEPGSILICLASEEHDPSDDYKLPY